MSAPGVTLFPCLDYSRPAIPPLLLSPPRLIITLAHPINGPLPTKHTEMTNPEGRMKRRRASTTLHLPVLPLALLASFLLLLLPKPTHAGLFRGSPQLGPEQCTNIEVIYIEDAVNALAKCVETSPEGIKYALNKQTETGHDKVLGKLELKKLNECLEKVKKKDKDEGEKDGEKGKKEGEGYKAMEDVKEEKDEGGEKDKDKEMDEECVKYVKKFQEVGNTSDGKEPAGKVAKKLMYDSEKFCKCMATIDPSEIFCYGMGVVRAWEGREGGREGGVVWCVVYDEEDFCKCMVTIDPSEIFCYGIIVVRRVDGREGGREGES